MITGNRLLLNTANANWLGLTNSGTALETLANDDSCAYVEAHQSIYDIKTEITILYYGNISSSASFGGLLSIPAKKSSWSTPYMSIAFDSRSSLVGRLMYAVAGSLNSFDSGAGFVELNKLHCYVVDLDTKNTSSGLRFFKNGVLHNARTCSSGDIDWQDKARPGIGSNDNYGNKTTEGVTAKANLAIIINRKLTLQEHSDIGINPIAVLSARESPVYFGAVGVAANVTMDMWHVAQQNPTLQKTNVIDY